ncbi:transporter family-2 protein [Okibacterium sp. HSC-33S16]|uniref:DMT family transporter n=1 Tax=Okibacterium sp. HSC-33S16 TaxID=2910965 RepID=UPI0020A0B55C|nr:DMT family transporter [Okibacterium sp. HSC-33S16]MCP2030169.1 transporter family-2 protein [Okibacterium sp. HSC-33S16]
MNSSPSRRLPAWASLVLAALCGAGIAVQTRINGALGVSLGDGFTAGVISFGSGLVILLVVMVLVPSGRRGVRAVWTGVRDGSMPVWSVLGGVAGAFFVLSQGVTGAVIGVALFSVALVAGQTISGLVLDRRGFGSQSHVGFTWPRLTGAALTVVAVAISMSSQLRGDFPAWMLLMPLVAGFGSGWQSAVNGRVRARAGSALSATFLNFLIGTTALVIVAVIRNAFAGWPTTLPAQPWLYLGGAIGCVFIGVNAYLVSHTGVLVLGLGTVTGQLLTSVAIDAFAPGAHPLAVTTVLGALLALIAVSIATLRVRPRDAREVG